MYENLTKTSITTNIKVLLWMGILKNVTKTLSNNHPVTILKREIIS